MLPTHSSIDGFMAGTSRATANRVLRQLENADVASLSRNGVRVLDPEQVARRAR